MKRSRAASILALALSGILLFGGCGSKQTSTAGSAAESTAESKVESTAAAESTAESKADSTVENAELLLGSNGESVKGTLAPLEAVVYEEVG